jgi:hypothetical protein
MRTQSTMSIARKWVMMRKALQELRYKCGRHNTDSAIPDMTEDQVGLALANYTSFGFCCDHNLGSTVPRQGVICILGCVTTVSLGENTGISQLSEPKFEVAFDAAVRD